MYLMFRLNAYRSMFLFCFASEICADIILRISLLRMKSEYRFGVKVIVQFFAQICSSLPIAFPNLLLAPMILVHQECLHLRSDMCIGV